MCTFCSSKTAVRKCALKPENYKIPVQNTYDTSFQLQVKIVDILKEKTTNKKSNITNILKLQLIYFKYAEIKITQKFRY